MSENNPYQTPASNLEESPTVNYVLNPNWDIGEVFNEAWQLTKGFKGTLIGAVFIYIAITMVVSVPFEFIGSDSVLLKLVSQIVIGLITYPLGVGLTMLGIKRSVGMPTRAAMVFDYYPKTIPIFLLYLLMMILIALGLVLLILPGIYLMMAYFMAIPLLVDKNMGIWEALETSRKTITQCWFRFFGLFLILMVIVSISMIPLGIGLIWAAPFGCIVMGIVYRSLFGVSQKV
jgi:hypothetical protein